MDADADAAAALLSPADRLAALRAGRLPGLRVLRLPGLGLTSLPPEILALAPSLELLDLSGNRLPDLPPDLTRLERLSAVFVSGNPMRRLPAALGGCAALGQIGARGCGLEELPAEALPPRLRWLTLTDNVLSVLPASLGRQGRLTKLLLAGNRLKALPAGLEGAASLELLRLAANDLDDLPGWIERLPSLAWLGWSANPFEGFFPVPAAQGIRWAELEAGALLGEGASGRVLAGRWRQPGAGDRPVALKLFKGAMTSDGLPEREMAACLAAGAHPQLTGALGRIEGHPDSLAGLVMPLLPAGWQALAGPPSLASCSRDVWPEAQRITPQAGLRLARAAATAGAHLHRRGLLHGDLYAHNLLWDGGRGEAVLSDFGAASVLPPGRRGLARLESRALGILLEELIAACPALQQPLGALAAACRQPEVARRPSLAEALAQMPEP
ncbi:protein kinase [Pseudoroseomonas deserti]|uniref:Protein kinase n=1 Tax=Teichococcus deserti TaxID=1817963 RepID=A0A1V2H1H7_9PROT|nr:leucine-rich repeat-containing protein kinase family protein [Pseudoroseomonas deserti]ONG52294.1 protein kinase [Pseudoroseomonas deserti]